MTAGDPRELPGRDRFAAYRDTLAGYGFRPSRRLGQNFLLDPSLHKFIAATADPGPADLILEIGPGLGFLTRELAARSRVLAVEIDSRLVRVLRDEVAALPDPAPGRVRILHADALQRNRLAPEVVDALGEELAAMATAGRFLLVANLPYAIAGPLVMELAQQPRPPAAMVLLLQLEMAQRLAAAPGSREYGALSAFLQLGYEVRFLRKVGAQAFRPRPRVDSGIVHLRALTGGILADPTAARRALAGFLRRVFASRRKKLRNAPALAGVAIGDPALRERLDCRPDTLEPPFLLRLWRAARDAADEA